MPDSVYPKIYAIIRRIPKGRVATYRQIARLAGLGQPRRVGYALSILTEGSDVPWHRVINSAGRVSGRWDPDAAGRQQSLLLEEGVAFDGQRRISLAQFQWKPPASIKKKRSIHRKKNDVG